jgi:hypothetical protein
LDVLDAFGRAAAAEDAAVAGASAVVFASPFCGAGLAGRVVSCACAAVQIATAARANVFKGKSRIGFLSWSGGC